jgi:hypothetical protein
MCYLMLTAASFAFLTANPIVASVALGLGLTMWVVDTFSPSDDDNDD